MIEFKIKTLDGSNHPFSVDDEITVQQLKDKIFECMGVEIGLQRLIFCGKVLQDEKKLIDYGVHGKVVHMVQRAPPSVEAQQAARDGASTPTLQPTVTHSEPITLSPVHFMNTITQAQIRRIMAMAARANGAEADELSGTNVSPTAARLESLRRLMSEIRTTLEVLKANERDELPVIPTEDPLESTSSAAHEPVQAEVICPIHQRPIVYQGEQSAGASRSGRGRGHRSTRQTPQNTQTPPSELGQLLQELREIENDFVPFREQYVNILREASDSTVVISERVLQRRQRTAELCAEMFHAIGHVYHTISDIELQLSHIGSRLTSEALLRSPQVHAQINVVQAAQPRGAANATVSGGGASQPFSGAPETQANTPQAGTNTQPTVSANVQPDPYAYQVEIETAVPILNFENVFMTGANANQGGQNQTNQGHLQSQNGPAQPHQDGQNDRPQVMIEFENLLRGLGQEGLANVEVLMSVEEIRGQGNGPQTGGAANDNSAAGVRRSQVPAGVFLGQSANLIHSIIQSINTASVARQAIVPGMEGATAQQPSGQNQQQGQGQGQGQPQSRPQTRFLADISPILNQNSHSEPPPETQPSQRSQSSAPRPGATQRGVAAQPQSVNMSNVVYDRFLPCESVHARRQLQRRRDQTALAAGPPVRVNSVARIHHHVDALYERFNRYAIDDESLMIATILFMHEAVAASTARALDVDELFPLRHRIRVYIYQLLNGEYAAGSEERLCDLMLERHSAFINRIATITPLHSNVDLLASLRAVFIRFLNEATLLLNVDRHYVFCRRFRTVFPRMFYELCGVISCCSQEGLEGFKKIYRAFLHELIRNIDEPVRELLHSLALENLELMITRMETPTSDYQHYVLRVAPSSTTEEQPTVQEPAEPESEKTEVTESAVDAAPKTDTETEGPCASSEPSVGPSSVDCQPTPAPEPMDTGIEVMPAEAAQTVVVVDSPPTSAPVPSDTPQQPPCEDESSAQNASDSVENKTQDVSTNEKQEKSRTGSPQHPKPVQTIEATAVCGTSASSSPPLEPVAREEAKLPNVGSTRERLRREISHSASGGESSQAASSASAPSSPVNGMVSGRTDNRRIAQSRSRLRLNRQNNSNSTTSNASHEAVFVPPTQLAQHWGEEWVPTFTSDLQRQRAADADEPLSDAYLTGMPPKKRRCLRQARPPTTLDAFIAESLREVAAPLTAVSDEWRAACREHVRRLVRRRVARDYEPRRFPATARFLAQDRSTRSSSDSE